MSVPEVTGTAVWGTGHLGRAIWVPVWKQSKYGPSSHQGLSSSRSNVAFTSQGVLHSVGLQSQDPQKTEPQGLTHKGCADS